MPDRGEKLVHLALAALLVVGTALYAVARDDRGRTTTDLQADAPYYYVYLPSLLLDGDLDFRNQYQETKNWYRFGQTPIGRQSNVFGIGPALMQAPLFALGHGVAIATGARRDGFSAWEVKPFTWAALPWSLGAVYLAYRLARRRVAGIAAAAGGAIATFLAGPVVYYAVHQPGYSHPHAAFWIALLVERWDASFTGAPRSVRTWLVLGAALGAAALARPQLALWGVLLISAVIDDVRVRGGLPAWRLLARWATGAAMSLLVFTPQLLAWKALYGRFYAVPQGPGFVRWLAPCWSEVLFSSRNGLLAWSPGYALCGLGLVLAVRRAPRLTTGLAAGLAGQIIANGAVWDWWAGGSFGGRRFDSTYIAFAVGGAVMAAWIGRALARPFDRGLRAVGRPHDRGPRAIAAAVAAAAVAVIAGLAIAANLHLAARTSVTSARITGGEPAPSVLRAQLRGPHGRVAAALSSLATWPARALFGVRHEVGLDAYDRIVGVHVLGDTYPGLNSYQDRRQDTIAFRDLGAPRFVGLTPGPAPGSARLRGSRGRILVALNRTGVVTLTARLTGSGIAELRWNGQVVAHAAIGDTTPLTFSTADLVRGANELTIDAPAGTVLAPIELVASPPAR